MHKKTLFLLEQFCLQENCRIKISSFERTDSYFSQYCALIPEKMNKLLIFCHGTGNDALFPHYQLFTELIRRNVGVFSFDLDGHGNESTALLQKSSFFKQLNSVQAPVQKLFGNTIEVMVAGYSLGGCLALAECSWIEFSKRFIIAMPTRVNVTLKSLVQELLCFRESEYLNAKKIIGFYDLLPALGPFKRKEFPIRIADDSTLRGGFQYSKIIDEILQKCMEDLSKCRNVERTKFVHFIYSDSDLIAPPGEGKKILQYFPDALFSTVNGCTHFSILLNRKLAEIIALNN